MRFITLSLLTLISGCSCQGEPVPADAGLIRRVRPRPDAMPVPPDAGPLRQEIVVEVRLDGEPVANAVVLQGGTDKHLRTDATGRVTLTLDASVVGDKAVIASHPKARVGMIDWDQAREDPAVIDLIRYDDGDNLDYQFQDPGDPTRRASTAQCGHCHQTINDAWYESPHRSSASNPYVHDLYAGTSHTLNNASDCEAKGGRWASARAPGGRAERCFIGEGFLTEQPDCADQDCLEAPAQTGACADCHAPGINGQLGGRDLLEAQGHALNYGVFCDACHRVEAVVEDAEPGVAGRLKLLRPSEAGDITFGAGGYLPLTFGPSHDSPNVRMGSVQRDHFRSGKICMGCHQLDQNASHGMPTPNPERWPDGALPIQSTYTEWKASPYADTVACNACHMPPDADVLNAADHQLFTESETGYVAGWHRPAGAVRQHSWLGPRQPESGLLELAASLFIATERQGSDWRVQLRTVNSGAGHALPTGEPQRQVLLSVELRCDETPQELIGGDVLPGYAGYVSRRTEQEDWSRWPQARAGDRIAVIRRPGAYRDYDGFGAFRANNWAAQDKGLRVEESVGVRTVTAVSEAGRITTDAELPQGDIAYLLRGQQTLAGQAGAAFARVTQGAQGSIGVPHFQATDLISDNRLMPQQEWISNHLFRATCDEPVAFARLIHRNFFWATATQKNWPVIDRVMTEVRR